MTKIAPLLTDLLWFSATRQTPWEGVPLVGVPVEGVPLVGVPSVGVPWRDVLTILLICFAGE